MESTGSRVTACGVLLYDSSENLIRDYREAVSNARDSLASFHAWYDIESEMGITLFDKTYAAVNSVTYEEFLYHQFCARCQRHR